MLNEVYSKFKDENEYKNYLFGIKQKERKTCPYCNSSNITIVNDKFLYHCNLCNTNHSLTANTIMHNSKLDSRKWLSALLIFTMNDYISYRSLSLKLGINKNTGFLILNKFYFIHQYYKLEIAKIIGINADKIEIFSRILLISLNKGGYISGK